MGKTYYHGRGLEGLRNIAETGEIKGSIITDDELFPRLEHEIGRGYEKGVWFTDSKSCAKAYAWGGGYLEVDGQDLQGIDDENSSYSVVVEEEIPIDHVERIMIEDRPMRNRDLALEVANLLNEEYLDIPIGRYEGEIHEIQAD